MSRHKERMDCFAALAMTWMGRSVQACPHPQFRSPDERSDIRGNSDTTPDIASLIRATNCVCNDAESPQRNKRLTPSPSSAASATQASPSATRPPQPRSPHS
jgi:hypothetical protein